MASTTRPSLVLDDRRAAAGFALVVVLAFLLPARAGGTSLTVAPTRPVVLVASTPAR